MTSAVPTSVLRSAYRSLLRSALAVDREPARRALLTAAPTKVYDHHRQEWVKTDHELRAGLGIQPQSAALNDVLRLSNGGRLLHVPSTDEAASVAALVRQAFRTTTGNSTSISDAFAAVKTLHFQKQIADTLSKEVSFATVDFGVELDDQFLGANPSKWKPSGPSELQLLVSHPLLPDFFRHAVVAMVPIEGDDGAMGFICNRPLTTDHGVLMPVWAALDGQMPRLFSTLLRHNTLMVGGPVHSFNARDMATLVVHRIDDVPEARTVAAGLYVQMSRFDDLEEAMMERNVQPSEVMVVLGYSGWGADQLSGEIAEGSWFVAKGGATTNKDIVFAANRVCAGDEAHTTDNPTRVWGELLASWGSAYADLTRLSNVELRRP